MRLDADGAGHIYGVIGPDEYHELVDDNAFTNVMARWNLRRGRLAERRRRRRPRRSRRNGGALAAAARRRLRPGHRLLRAVRRLLRARADRSSPTWPTTARGRGPPARAERIARSQVVKQADVLMLHHLVPDEVGAGIAEANLDYYGPRTRPRQLAVAGRSTRRLLARAGRPTRRSTLFGIACRLDLDDLTGTTAGGLHMATMGGVWQALVDGFLRGAARP